MENNGKIYITISDVRMDNGVTPTPQTTSTMPMISGDGGNDNDGISLNGLINHQFYDFAINTAKQMVDFATENIGNFTGDYYVQRSINNVKSISGDLMAIGVGFAKGGVVGGLIATTGVLINRGMQYQLGGVSNRKQNYEISQLREISGLNSLTNGSR